MTASVGGRGGSRLESASGVEVEVLVDGAELSRVAADRIAESLRDALGVRDRASLVLSGGATPLGPYRELVGMDLPWDRIDLFWGDERCVPPDDAASNFGQALSVLLDAAAVPTSSIHRMRGELGPERAADDYERRLRLRFATEVPEFDLVLMGIGEDGHTASLFPGMPEGEPHRWVVPGTAPRPPVERVSLSYRGLSGARSVLFLVAGQAKARACRAVLDGTGDTLPAARVTREASRVVWLLTRDAAGDDV